MFLEPLELFPPRSSVLALRQSQLPGPPAGLFIGRPEGPGGQLARRAWPRGRPGCCQPGPLPAAVHEQAGRDPALQHAQEAGQLAAARLHALQPAGRLQRLLPRLPPQREEHPLPLHAGAPPTRPARPSPAAGLPSRPRLGASLSLGPGQGGPRHVQSPGGLDSGSGWGSGAGPTPWPYLVRVKLSGLFTQTDIFQALTPRAALQMVPEEVFV